MQRFLDPEGLRSRGIEHFDAWAATFGEVVDTMEITPDGAGSTTQPVCPVHEPAGTPADVPGFRRRPDGRDAEPAPATTWRPASRSSWPRPDVGGAAGIAARAGRNAMSVCVPRKSIRGKTTRSPSPPMAANWPPTHGCSQPTAPDFPESKINRLVENVAATWERSTPTRGTQMIFADMGVNPTPWGYSPYEEVIEKLVAEGYPPRADRRDGRR